ncbi:hypothetical protein YC2023_076708 [Brassica napus]
MVSWKYQFVAESNNIRAMRYRMGNVRLRIYAHASRPRPIFVCIYSHASRPSPRWFVLHPMQRRFKPVHSSQCRINQYNSSRLNRFLKQHKIMDPWQMSITWVRTGTDSSLYPAPLAGSCYGLGDLLYRWTHERQACPHRKSPSASLKDKKKIYVFGGCWDVADSSNWVEVFDLETRTWEFLFLFTPKMPLNIQQRVVINGQIIYGVDEDGQIFYFTPSTNPMFMTNGIVEPNPENRNE